VCLVVPDDDLDPADEHLHFGGPRSRWGAPLARAVHAAVLAGTRSCLDHAHRPDLEP
jgi:hypothetical protein